LRLVLFVSNSWVKPKQWWFNIKTASKLVLLSFLIIANVAFAAPKSVMLTYQATRNGKPFANVTETFKQVGDQYVIESVTEGIGLAALFGKRILRSEGFVTVDGLQPKHFEQHQGDNEKKAVYADFNWVTNQLSMKNKGNVITEPLAKSTQDVASFPYQWMLFPPKGEEISVPITTGKKQRIYTYKVIERDVKLTVDAGQFKTLHLSNTSETGNGNDKEFWLAVESFCLPVKIIMHEDNETIIEQTLTSIHLE
jgi:Protein of unknown function (DUF3108)